jgi:hypothetical protein
MMDEPMGSSTQGDDYSSSAPSEGSSVASTFESPLHADGVDHGDPVFECGPFDLMREAIEQGGSLPLCL